MKVLLAAYDKTSSGISSYTMEVANLLQKYADIAIMSLDKISSPFRTIFIEPTKRYRAFPLFNYLNNRTLASIFEEFDIVHETLPPWSTGADKYITTKWGYESFLGVTAIRLLYHPFPENLGSLPVTLQHALLDHISMKNARHVVDVSLSTGNFIPPPIRIRKIKKYESSERLKILFVSRDIGIRRKNLGCLTEALKLTSRKTELHLVGNGSVNGSDKETVIHGYIPREKLTDLMYEMDLLVLPSIYEELGYVGLEAYSIGLPVITSNIQSFRAILKESPKFNPFKPKELSKILDNLSTEDLEILGKKSWNHAKLSNEIARERFLSLYSSVMEEEE